ncbi:ABC transporter permease [Tuberibacillus sp. Marseille-P3662]|uniref:ABC transporter permease n=1 Tax=Tuberibacillus sp. Marseille-P3662 TaxID=1965358 RepID=UPI000A1CB40F|nr:ABC transporter permease [Tuberibacillus sp. Marseille-P3662]
MTFRRFAINNVLRNKRTYAAYFLSSALSVMVFFVYALFIFHPGIGEGTIRPVALKGMTAAEYIIYVFSFLFILYSVGIFLKTRHHEFGVLMMHGMTRGQLNRLVFFENMLIGLTAVVVGIGVGLVFAKLFLMIGANVMGINLPFYLSWQPLVLTLGAFIGLFLVISLLTPLLIRKRKVINLLQGSTKPKKEPRASLIVSILTVVALIIAYYLSVTTKGSYMLENRIMTVVPLTIIATYFLFSQLSVFVIRMLKRKRSFYMEKTHMITLSHLTYKMKDNARMFFFVTIVTTVAFCAVGSIASMTKLDDKMAVEYPFGVSYVSLDGDDSMKQHLNVIEQDIQAKDLSYKKVSLTVKTQRSAQTHHNVTLVSEQDYNRFAKTLGYSKLTLGDHEAKFIPVSLEQQEGLVKRDHQTVTLQPSDQQLTITGAANQIFYKFAVGSNVIVIPDQVFQSLSVKDSDHPSHYAGATYIGYEVDDWKTTEGIASELDKDNSVYTGQNTYKFSVSGQKYAETVQIYSVMLFIGILVGAVFFIAAGSFLYFRLLMDLESDKQQYRALSRIGLTEKELNRIVTTQIALLFFVPIVVAVIHSVFAFNALQSLFNLSVTWPTIWVLGAFILVQVVYFLFIRLLYLSQLKQAIIQ